MIDYLTADSELFYEHNGILFLKPELGGFNYSEARHLLPLVIKMCRDCYDNGIVREAEVGFNGSKFRLRIRGREVVRAR